MENRRGLPGMYFQSGVLTWSAVLLIGSTFSLSVRALDTEIDVDTDGADPSADTGADTTPNETPDTETEAPDTASEPGKEPSSPKADASEQAVETAADSNVQNEPLETDDDMMGMDLESLLETPIEVWSATKTKQTVAEAPAIMTVVTKEEIRSRGYRSVAEILHHTLGFYIVDDHMIPNLGIRGVAGGFMGESGTVKVMIDGQSVAFHSTGGNWLGPELIPMSAVERVEIIRGPASALYGADAFLGVVNIITLKGADLNLGSLEAWGSVNANTNFGHDLDVAMGARRGNFEIMLSGRTAGSDLSDLTLPASSPAPHIPSHNEDAETTSHLLQTSQVAHGKLSYYFKDRNSVSLTGHIAKIERGGEFSPWSQLSYGLDDAGHQRGTTISLYQSMIGLDSETKLGDQATLNIRATYLQGQPTSEDKIDTGNALYAIQRDFGYRAVEAAVEGNVHIIEPLTAVLGTEFLYDWENLPSSLHVLRESTDTQSAGEIQEESSTRQGDLDLYNIGAFAQLLWSGLRPYLDLTGGFRYDYHSIYGNQFSGRAGAISNPHKMLYLKLLYGSAFKAPSPLLLYGVPHEVGDIIGNPDLKPQKAHTVEGQAILKPWPYLSFSTGLAYSLLLDKAEFVQQGINRVADNISEMKSLSWESEIAANYKDWVSGRITLELQSTTRSFDEQQSVYLSYLVGDQNVIYPAFILRADLNGRIPKLPIRLGLGIMTVGERPSSEMNAIENLKMYTLPVYTLLDAQISTVGLSIVDGKETTVSIVGKNLTNRHVADPGFAGVDYPILPLTVMLQLRQAL